jgi:Icc-related predicted phosphoesterase
MKFYEKPNAELIDFEPTDAVMTLTPGSEGLGDDEDPAHWGFATLRELLDQYHPQYLIHGHVHMSYNHKIPRVIEYNGTKIINAYERAAKKRELKKPDHQFHGHYQRKNNHE